MVVFSDFGCDPRVLFYTCKKHIIVGRFSTLPQTRKLPQEILQSSQNIFILYFGTNCLRFLSTCNFLELDLENKLSGRRFPRLKQESNESQKILHYYNSFSSSIDDNYLHRILKIDNINIANTICDHMEIS